MFTRSNLARAVVFAALLAGAGISLGQQRTETQTGEEIYGRELMTQQERQQFQRRMREANTEQERERIRAEHHWQMQERARQQDKMLPDMPPSRPGAGAGGGGGPRR
jgi:hypothetical protein